MRGRPLYHLAKAVGQGSAMTTIIGKNRAAAPETAFSTVPNIIEKFAKPGDVVISKKILYFSTAHVIVHV
jgi:hypothetical protein